MGNIILKAETAAILEAVVAHAECSNTTIAAAQTVEGLRTNHISLKSLRSQATNSKNKIRNYIINLKIKVKLKIKLFQIFLWRKRRPILFSRE
jgi:hypothetical protein